MNTTVKRAGMARVVLNGSHTLGPTKSRPDAARSGPDASQVGRDSNPCRIVMIPSATAGLSVVTVEWL